jgi:hypothetical protein
MRPIYWVVAIIVAFATQASAQAPNIAIDEFMVQSEPGIEIYVRNKRPADMTAFRPERTVLFVHGSTYPASTSFDLKLGETSWISALIWKFLYEFLVTRWPPLPLSATSAPSSMRQLASPVLFQSPMVLPSVSVTQPGPVWPTACGAS